MHASRGRDRRRHRHRAKHEKKDKGKAKAKALLQKEGETEDRQESSPQHEEEDDHDNDEIPYNGDGYASSEDLEFWRSRLEHPLPQAEIKYTRSLADLTISRDNPCGILNSSRSPLLRGDDGDPSVFMDRVASMGLTLSPRLSSALLFGLDA